MVSKVAIVSMVLIVSIVWLSCLYIANADMYKTLGVSHNRAPLTCIFEPDPKYTHDQSKIMEASETAINNWEVALNEYSPSGYWELRTIAVPFELHDKKTPDDFRVCNILISFEYMNSETSALGFTHIDFSKSWHKYMHIVLYLNTYEDLNMPKITITFGESGSTIEVDASVKEFPIETIQNIISHEFGHALGAGHYQLTSPPISNKPWIDTSIMYYALDPSDTDLMIPKYVDVKMIELIYGSDGFGGQVPLKPPRINYYNIDDVDICSYKCNK